MLHSYPADVLPSHRHGLGDLLPSQLNNMAVLPVYNMLPAHGYGASCTFALLDCNDATAIANNCSYCAPVL